MSKYEYQSRVRYSECGEDCCLSLGGVVNYFQDAATFQGEDLGIGIPYLRSRNLAWILVSWQIVTDHMPRLGENITVRTWAYSFTGFYGFRNLELVDENGDRAVWANSIWVMMDTERGRPVKVPEKLLSLYGEEEKLDMEYAPRRVNVPENGEEQEPFTIRRAHLDSNHHVNNKQYIQMALDYLPEDFPIRETRVEYREQAFLGDVIRPLAVRTRDSVTVSLQKEAGNVCAVVCFFRQEQSSRNQS